MANHGIGRRVALGMAALAAVAACLAWAGTATASNPSSPNQRFRDPNWKYSMMVFDDWPQVPLETQGQSSFVGAVQKAHVARFIEKDEYVAGGLGRFQAGVIAVFRMGKPGAGEETTGEGSGATVRETDAPKSMRELLAKVCERAAGVALLDPKTAKEVKTKDGVPGLLWTIDKSGAFQVAAAWKKDEVEYGVWLACDSVLKKKYELGFSRVVSSFTWFDEKAEDVQTKDVLNGVRISARKRREIEKGLVKGWDVIVSPFKNYVVVYNTMGKRNNRLAKLIAERIELIRAQVYEALFPPAKAVEAVSVVRVCGDAFEYRAYGGPWGSAGYWSDDTEELVFYDANPKKAEADDDTLAVLYHEAFHQYVYYSVGKVAPHSWFNEGHGDYFAGAKYGGGKFTIKPFNWRVARVKDAIKKGPCPCQETTDADGDPRWKWDRSGGGYSPLSALVKFPQGEYYSYPSISYAQGWSLVYFLREIVPKNKEWNAKWGGILQTYFDTLKAEVNKDTPLVPKGLDPDDGDPGMDTPGMGDDPGMGDPGMGDPGMGDPGMGDDPSGGDSDDPGIPQRFMKYESSKRALRKSIQAAFQGVDFDELETAWKSSILKIPDPPPRPRR